MRCSPRPEGEAQLSYAVSSIPVYLLAICICICTCLCIRPSTLTPKHREVRRPVIVQRGSDPQRLIVSHLSPCRNHSALLISRYRPFACYPALGRNARRDPPYGTTELLCMIFRNHKPPRIKKTLLCLTHCRFLFRDSLAFVVVFILIVFFFSPL